MQVSLVMFKADGTRRDFPVTKARFVIGRTTVCDLRIPLASVSRQHCEIRVEGSKVYLRDLGSSNGTQHNSVRVQEVTLKPGDEIAIGSVVFTVVLDGQPQRIKPVRSASPAASASAGADATGGPAIDAQPDDDAEVEPAPAPPREPAPAKAAIAKPAVAKTPALAKAPSPTKPAPAKAAEPETLSVRDDDEIPTVEAEKDSPTVDLDDPIAALEALARTESAEDDKSPAPGPAPAAAPAPARHEAPLRLADEDEDDDEPVEVIAEDDDDQEIPLLADDEDEPPKAPPAPGKSQGR